MSWFVSHWFVLVLMALYLGVMMYHAWVGKARTRNVTDYFVGGRSLGGVAIGISFFATYSSTNSFVGFAGQAYAYGPAWLLLAPVIVSFCLGAWLLVAPRLRLFTERLGSVTIPDFVGFRFGSRRARICAAVVVVFGSIFYMTAVFKGIGNTIEAFLGLPYWASVLVVFLVVVTYTAVGGFISVVRTDIVQGLMLVIAAVALFVGTVSAAGGIGAIWQEPAVADPGGEPWGPGLALPLVFGAIVASTSKLMIEPRQLSRFYALKDRSAIRQGLWISTACFLFVYVLLAPIGLYARHFMPAGITDTDRIVPALLTDPAIFHPAVSALMFLAMLAAAMSSLDSVLLVTASTCQRDLAGLWRAPRSDAAAVNATRGYVVLFAVVTTAMALRPPGDIIALTSFSGGLYAACFFPAVLFGLYWKRGGGTAVIASMAVGIITLFAWKPLALAPVVHEVFPAILFSVIAYVVVAVQTPPDASEVIERLFASESSRPLPEFAQPVPRT